MKFNWKNRDDEWIVKFLTEMHSRMEKGRDIYSDLHTKIVRIFRPRRYDILPNDARSEGEQYGAEVYDQHPANALAKMVGGMVGYIMSRSIPWIQLIASDRRLMELDHIKEYCQNATEQTLYGAARSNFYSAMTPHALDAHSIGTSVIIPMTDEVKDRVVFDVVHPRDSYIAGDKYGDAIIYHRNLRLTRMTAIDYFGIDAVPDNWFKGQGKRRELKQLLAEDDYIWCVYPNDDRDESSMLPEDRQFAVFCVMKSSSGPKKSRLVLKSGMNVFPTCWRSLRESGANYGTSLAADCLTGGLISNILSEKGIMAAHLTVEPPVVASKSIRASLLRGNLNPRSRVYVDDMQREGVKTIMDRLNWPLTDAQIQRLDAQIDDRLFIRFFEMLSAGEITTKTAYEVSQMMAEKATLMSTVVDTTEQESIEPNIANIIIHETEAGRMPDPPEELISGDGSYLNVELRYLGPLHQLQRTLLKTKGTVDALSVIAQMAAMDESVAWKFNFQEAAEEAAVAQGWSQKHVFSDEEVAATTEKVERMRAAQAEAEVAEKMGRASAAASKRIEPGSMMERLTQAQAMRV
jgi:hypothetical protein